MEKKEITLDDVYIKLYEHEIKERKRYDELREQLDRNYKVMSELQTFLRDDIFETYPSDL